MTAILYFNSLDQLQLVEVPASPFNYHEPLKALLVFCPGGICTLATLLPSALVYAALKPLLPIKPNYLIVLRKRKQEGHTKINLSLFNIWVNVHGMLLALFAQLFLTLWWCSILDSVVSELIRLTQHLPPGQGSRQDVKPKCVAPTYSLQTQTLQNFLENEELKEKIVQSITMCNFNARHNGSSYVGGYYFIINLNQMPKDLCHLQRLFHHALREVFQWKKIPLPPFRLEKVVWLF